ncbi:hypothetical protein [Propionivibrio sp.]|uniref:hypothetical protein n=1 Tax=Propionivibrio sp. TaxID=2212460 RepID=UPI003BEF7809
MLIEYNALRCNFGEFSGKPGKFPGWSIRLLGEMSIGRNFSSRSSVGKFYNRRDSLGLYFLPLFSASGSGKIVVKTSVSVFAMTFPLQSVQLDDMVAKERAMSNSPYQYECCFGYYRNPVKIRFAPCH